MTDLDDRIAAAEGSEVTQEQLDARDRAKAQNASPAHRDQALRLDEGDLRESDAEDE